MKNAIGDSIRRNIVQHYPLHISLIFFCTLLVGVQWVKYVSGRFSLFDLGVFDQALWTFLAEGRPLHSINFSGEPFNWLGFHFSPLVLSLSIFYTLVPSAFILCLVQILIVASTVIPIYLSAKALGLKKSDGHILAVLFLAHPFTLNGASWDFHEIAFAVPLMAWGLYAVIRRNFFLLCVIAASLLMVKEHYGLAAVGLGALWAVYTKDWTRGVVIGILGTLVFALIIFLLMPALTLSGTHPMLAVDERATTQLARYAWLHEPIGRALEFFSFNILMKPLTLAFLLLLLFSFGPLSLLGALFLLAGFADLIAAMLSATPMPRSPFSYHALSLAPVMTVAAAYGLSRIGGRQRRNALISACIITGALSYINGPFPLPGAFDVWQIKRAISTGVAQPEQIDKIREIIPADASVSAQPNIGYFFSKRLKIYAFPDGDQADFIILHIDYPFESFATTVFRQPFEGESYVGCVRKILLEKRRPIIFYDDGWLVFAPPLTNNPIQSELGVAALKRLEWMDITYRIP